MANPSLLIKVAANIDALKASMKDGSALITATTASAAKLASSLNGEKLSQHAQNVAVAIRSVGVETLTAAQASKQLDVLERSMEKLRLTGQKIPPDIAKLAKELEHAKNKGQSWSQWLGGANRLLGVFGVSLGVGAVVAFGKSLLRMGDEFVRVADRTGLTTDEVQRLSYVAGQSGNSIDELTGAIGQMQNRLASGDKSAIASVRTLGVNFKALVSASPAQQMEMIATAIAKIPDPAERTRIAMDLFGKTGTAILPTLTSQFAGLAKQAPVMSANTVKALDQAGDQLDRFGLQIKVWAAESYNFLSKGFDAVIGFAYKAVAALLDVTAKVVGMAQKIPGASKVLGALGVDLKALTSEAQWFRDAASGMAAKTDVVTSAAKRLSPEVSGVGRKTDDATKSVVENKQAIDKLLPSQNTWELGIAQLIQRVPDLSEHVRDQAKAFRELDNWIAPLASRELPALHGQIARLPNVVAANTAAIDAARGSTKKATTETKSFTVALGGLSSILSGVNNKFAQTAVVGLRAGEEISKVASAASKSAEGFTKGDWIQIALIGVTALASGFKTLFGGVSQAEKDARAAYNAWAADIVKNFDNIASSQHVAEAAGRDWAKVNITVRDAYESVGLTGEQAMADLGIALDATHHSAADVERALKTINDVLAEQKQDAADLDAAIQKYGFSIEELGPKLQQQKLTEQAMTLMNDFRLLAGAGIDVDTVLGKMGGSINDFVRTALRTGQEVPSHMQPMLQKMIDMGTLTDASGAAITDLSTSGLTFSETLTQGFDRVVKKFDELLAKIGMVPAAIGHIPTSIPEPWANWKQPSFGGVKYGSAPWPMAAGGDMITTRPTLFVSSENSRPERVTFSGEGKATGNNSSGVSTAALERELRALRRDLPRAVAIAVSDAVVLAPRRAA